MAATEAITLNRVTALDIQDRMAEYLDGINALKSVEVKMINDPVQFRNASEMLGAVKGTLKTLDSLRTELKAPALDEGKRIDAAFKQYSVPLAELQKKLEAGMDSFAIAEKKRKDAAIEAARKAEAERLKAEADRLLEEAAKNEALAAEAPSEEDEKNKKGLMEMEVAYASNLEQQAVEIVNKDVNGKVYTLHGSGSMTTNTEWTFEITDSAAVPRPYCEPVDSLLRKAVKAGVREIAGVRIYEKAKFTNR
jgi:hypothetical protein